VAAAAVAALDREGTAGGGRWRAYPAASDPHSHFGHHCHPLPLLPPQLDELRRREANDERVMFRVATENRAMSEPLRKVLSEVSVSDAAGGACTDGEWLSSAACCERKHSRGCHSPPRSHPLPLLLPAQIKRLSAVRGEYRGDLAALGALKAETAALQAAHDELQWEAEVTTQRLEAAACARDGLRARFSDAVHEVERRAGLRRLLAQCELAETDAALAAAMAVDACGTGGSGEGGGKAPGPASRRA
jgi:hypothetical protein